MTTPFKKLLMQQQATIVPIDKKVYTASKSKYPNEVISTHLLIPPNRADIEFNKKKKYFKTVPKTFKGSDVPLPEYWANYDPNVSKYASIVTKPENQQKCGSCFAFAVATAMNDVFIFGNNLNFNPDISPLSVLSCVKDKDCNAQCGGGNPICILHHVENEGLTTNNCMNYTNFCDNDKNCYTPAKKAFDEKTKNKIFMEDVPTDNNDNIPACGCCPNCDNNYSYYIKDVTLVSTTNGNNIDATPNANEVVKHHLMNYGSAVSGFIVYANFINDVSNGKFEKTKGIYIETENYSSDPNDKPKKFMGCHAIVVVGWGIEKSEIKLDDGSVLKNTPYWIVRNSWTSNWGFNGYFKIAMSHIQNGKEVNPDTSLGTINDVMIENQNVEMGGIILFKPSDIKPYKKERTDCNEKKPCSEKSPFTNNNTLPPVSTIAPTKAPSKSNSQKNSDERDYILKFIYLMILFLFVLFLLSRLRK